MRKIVSVVALVGLLGCGSSKTAMLGTTTLPVQDEGSYTPAAYVAQADTAAGDFLKLHLGAGVSAVWPKDNSLDNTYMIDLAGQIDLIAGLSVEVAVGFKTFEYTDSTLSDTGDLSVTPIYATALYAMGAGNIKVYFGGGLQWNITDISEISGLSPEDKAGYHAVLGVNLSQGRFSLQVEGRYEFTDIGIDYSTPDPSITLDGDQFLGRVKFLMNF
jgi:hypothetical protein